MLDKIRVWSAFKQLDETVDRSCVVLRIWLIKFNGGKPMFAADLEELMINHGMFLEEICVSVFCYDINNWGKDIKRRERRHCGILNVELYR